MSPEGAGPAVSSGWGPSPALPPGEDPDPALPPGEDPDPALPPGLAERLEHRWRPLSAGVAVPVFAFFAAGVSLRYANLGAVLTDPVVIGVVAGLVLGKTIGIFGSTFVLARFTRAELDEDITWADLLGLALLAGVGFTASLPIGELAFGAGSATHEHVKVGVLCASLIAPLAASLVLAAVTRSTGGWPSGNASTPTVTAGRTRTSSDPPARPPSDLALPALAIQAFRARERPKVQDRGGGGRGGGRAGGGVGWG